MGQILNQDTDKKNFALSKVLLSRDWSFIKTTKNVHPPTPLVVGDGGQQLADIFKISV